MTRPGGFLKYAAVTATDAAGRIVERYDYDAGGRLTTTMDRGRDRGFTGYIADNETGWYFARTRMYGPGLGHFGNRMPWLNLNGETLSAWHSDVIDDGVAAFHERQMEQALASYIQGRFNLYDFMAGSPSNGLEPYSTFGWVDDIQDWWNQKRRESSDRLADALNLDRDGHFMIATASYDFQWVIIEEASSYCPTGRVVKIVKVCHAVMGPFKKKKPGLSGKEGSKEVPSWAQGQAPKVGESGNDFAQRVLDCRFPERGGIHPKGPTTDFNKLRKYADRSFE